MCTKTAIHIKRKLSLALPKFSSVSEKLKRIVKEFADRHIRCIQFDTIDYISLTLESMCMPSKGSTKAALNKTKKDCGTDCGEVYKPVCAGDGSGKNNKSFGNECVLNKYICESGNQLKIVSQGECPGGGGVRLQ
ncbi:unnamed protein product [Acanthoscelides obtectus]|uniref:Kazal-like domain-containing protein n=1 Tax=Acanthoscelides obtectus TaxID=200917 RepID=A0A9P0KD06_ACAOB|nr:unnamed protein product [Acanthoscelides obtectus]CAK1667512.1 hypothetical protein AOBTE_LOCUS25881 [Acanthoscelides obtectus]